MAKGAQFEDVTTKISIPAIIGIIAGSVVFSLVVIMSVCIYAQRKRSRRAQAASPKRFLLPREVKPVIGFKTAAGPGGLKKSPSPVQSPENPDVEWGRRSTYSTTKTIPAMDEPDLHGGKIDCEMEDTSEMKCRQEHDGEKDAMLENNNINLIKSTSEMGSLNFNLRYSFEKNALQVTIVGASNLPPRKQLNEDKRSKDEISILDPYVKLQLLPEKQHKVKTRVMRNALNPVYDEDFTFYGISYNQLQSTTLHFVVVGFDRYSRDEIIGEVLFPLHSADLADCVLLSFNTQLTNKTAKFQNQQNRGELLVSLCHHPASNRITAVVLKAKELPKFDVTGLADPYVKIYLLYNGQRVSKKKTHVKKKTLDPVFNESFTFELPSTDSGAVENIGFEFLIMDWDRVTRNEVMGRIDIGMKAKSEAGRLHWEEIKKSPRKQIAQWHKLRAA